MQFEDYLEFGPFNFYLTEQVLTRGGEIVPLTPMASQLLALLVERSNQLCRKEEIVEHLWPDSNVGENSLVQIVYLLRKALEDDPISPKYIATVSRRGYKFIAAVKTHVPTRDESVVSPERLPASETPSLHEADVHTLSPSQLGNNEALLPQLTAASKRRRILSLVTYALLMLTVATLTVLLWRRSFRSVTRPNSPITSIAVLPFQNTDVGRSTEVLRFGLSDAIIQRLPRLNRHFKVLPLANVVKFDRDQDPLQVGRQLHVDGIVTGTLERKGEQLRVTARLLDVRTAQVIWTASFDGSGTDLFSTEDGICERLVGSLAWQLSGKSGDALPKGETSSAEAYRLYRLGVFHWSNRSPASMNKAVSYFQQALSIDPNFARAYAQLADTLLLQVFLDPNESALHDSKLREASQAADKAISLDESIVEAYVTRAALKIMCEGDLEAANGLYQRALVVDPNNAFAQLRYGFFLRNIGKIDEALHYMQRASEIDPTSCVNNTMLADLMIIRHDPLRASEYVSRALELDPTNKGARSTRGVLYLANENYRAAMEEFQKLCAEDDADIRSRLYLALALALGGHGGKARDEINRYEATPDRLQKQTDELTVILAEVRAALTEDDRAFELLNAVGTSQPLAYKPDKLVFPFLLHYDPLLDHLRSDKRYEGLLMRHPLPKLNSQVAVPG